MCIAICFDRELQFMAIEVQDEMPDTELSTEFDAALSVAYGLPQDTF
jgi:hypothetical protein